MLMVDSGGSSLYLRTRPKLVGFVSLH